jgi:hypothetical protein
MRAEFFKQAAWMSVFAFAIFGGEIVAIPLPVHANAGGEEAADSSFDNLDIVDSGLNGKLGVERVGSEVGENNLLTVFAGLKNKTGRQLNLQIETIYKDKDGNALNAGSWIPFTLSAHAEKEYRSSAISEAASDFLVRVRRAPEGSKE